jgi:multiple sugar transport system substrate-binding protein
MDGNRRMPNVRMPRAIGWVAAIAVVATACNTATPSLSSTSPSAAPTAVPSASIVNITPEPIAAGPGPNGGVVVRWFIGLGAGTQPAQIGPEQAFITAYNSSQSDVYLQYEIVDNTQAANILKT